VTGSRKCSIPASSSFGGLLIDRGLVGVQAGHMTSVIDATEVPRHGPLIGGPWSPAAQSFDRRNPARPAHVVGRSAAATTQDVEAAYAADTAAAAGWAALPAAHRGAIRQRAADLVLEREPHGGPRSPGPDDPIRITGAPNRPWR
jgi:Aldehyde dehydrogenase family